MLLEGSCHCQAVKFRCESTHPVPYQRCYCGICRKAGGGGGYLINIEADAATLHVEGREHLQVYRAMISRDGNTRPSRHERHFCGRCGCHVWAFNTHWPDLIHPVAGAIDTPLPAPPANVHMMVGSKAPWVRVGGLSGDEHYDEYPAKSLADWHREHGVQVS